jgi:hypothetical protein
MYSAYGYDPESDRWFTTVDRQLNHMYSEILATVWWPDHSQMVKDVKGENSLTDHVRVVLEGMYDAFPDACRTAPDRGAD